MIGEGKMVDLKQKDNAYIAHTYGRYPVEIVSGKGSEAYDENGRRYIDLTSGIGVNAFGFCDEEWMKAVTAQLQKVQHTSNLFYTEPCAALAEALCRKTGMRKVFFCNSGAEANECAIKAARKYSALKKGEDCYTVVTLENSFHGRTLTTLAATGQEHYHELYKPLTPGFESVPANDLAALENLFEKVNAAGFMIECIQGEGGVRELDGTYVKKAAALCKEKDIPLIVDEVQTGNGRTGKLYSYMHFGIAPDIVTTAKGLGGGLPIGAALLSEKLENVFEKGDHGSTFGGNPVVCAGALSVLSRFDDAFLETVAEKGVYLKKLFTGAPGIEEVSGKGLMIGLKTKAPAAQIVSACMARGVLCLTAKEKVRLLPALNTPLPLLEEAAKVILDVCTNTDESQ